jgi:uncharacterized membrane protein YdbT with pleckstrin-like domain
MNPVSTQEETLFEGTPALVPGLGSLVAAVLTLGLALIYFWGRRAGTTYRVTSQRIVIESGLFSKKLEQIDLYRVNDFVVERPFSQRMLGTGNLRMTTFDKSTPAVELVGLKTDVVALYEKTRAAVEVLKQARGVRMVDMEQP